MCLLRWSTSSRSSAIEQKPYGELLLVRHLLRVRLHCLHRDSPPLTLLMVMFPGQPGVQGIAAWHLHGVAPEMNIT